MAAEELAGYESRFAKIETDLAVIKWMLGSSSLASRHGDKAFV